MIFFSNILELFCTNFFLTGYISGNNTFPQPLDEKEEEKYLELLKSGDKKAKGVLIERNLRLDRKSTRLNSSHNNQSRMPSSA